MSVTSVLQAIGGVSRPLAVRDLRGLSNLDRRDRNEFLEAWQRIAPQRRTEIAREMVDLAEDNVELNFGEVWSWLLEDRSPEVRLSAVEGMWEDASPRALRAMLTMLRDDPSPDVRSACATGLSRFAYSLVLGEIDDEGGALHRGLTQVALNEDEPLEVRRRALESAGYFADDDAVQQQIARDYAQDEQLLRESALVAMGRSMLPRWLPTIEKALTNESPALRYEAARAAGEMAEEAQRLLPKVAALLNDRDTEIALAATWALGQIGGDAARRVLQQASKGQDAARSQAATEALDELLAGESLV